MIKKKDENKDKIDKKNLKRKVSFALDLPKEILLGLPCISIVGREDMVIENYKGIIEYSEKRIRLNTNCGVLKIEGSNLFLKQITSENILITGLIIKLEYVI